jgi:hypothetical protein
MITLKIENTWVFDVQLRKLGRPAVFRRENLVSTHWIIFSITYMDVDFSAK